MKEARSDSVRGLCGFAEPVRAVRCGVKSYLFSVTAEALSDRAHPARVTVKAQRRGRRKCAIFPAEERSRRVCPAGRRGGKLLEATAAHLYAAVAGGWDA